jgi:hypothetical protein
MRGLTKLTPVFSKLLNLEVIEMARQRRTSTVLETARQRLAGLKNIDSLNLGPTLTKELLEGKIASFTARLDSHNQLNATLDESTNATNREEDELQDLIRRYLSAVEAHYGPDSSEYEMVGGTRKSDRKRPKRKPVAGSSGTDH